MVSTVSGSVSAVLERVSPGGAASSWVNASEGAGHTRKVDTDLLARLRAAELFEIAAKLEQCRKIEYFRPVESEFDLEIVRPRCRHFLCASCQRIKAFRVSKEVTAILEELLRDNPGLKVFWGVFTLPACEAERLDEQIGILINRFRKLMQSASVKKHLIGAIRFIEVPFNPRTGTFNVHLNAVIVMRGTYMSKGYLSQATWLKLWQRATKSSHVKQIRIKRVQPNPKNSLSLKENVANLVRYSMKPSESTRWPRLCLTSLVKAIRKRRLYEFLGSLKAIRKRMKPRKLHPPSEKARSHQPSKLPSSKLALS